MPLSNLNLSARGGLLQTVRRLHKEGKHVDEIAELIHKSRRTTLRLMQEAGVNGKRGRPKKIVDSIQERVYRLMADRTINVTQASHELGVSERTVYRRMQKYVRTRPDRASLYFDNDSET